MNLRTRRNFLRVSGLSITSLAAGCVGGDAGTRTDASSTASDDRTSSPTAASENPATESPTETETPSTTATSTRITGSGRLSGWVPRPKPLNGHETFLVNDGLFWKLSRIQAFESDLHPEFYDRIASVDSADWGGIDAADVTTRIDVASQGATIYLGSFDPEAVRRELLADEMTLGERVGEFQLFTPATGGRPAHVAASAAAVVVSKGRSIRTSDDRTSEIDAGTLLEHVISTGRGTAPGYAQSSDSFRTLDVLASEWDFASVRTFERVSETVPSDADFAGTVGIADGASLARPDSTYHLVFLYQDSASIDVDPIRSWLLDHPGFSEFDELTFETRGRTLRVSGEMENDRFDAYLPGDPADRA